MSASGLLRKLHCDRRSLAACAALAACYFALARLSLRVDEVSRYLSAVWPASGLALAACLTFGRKMTPGIFLGSVGYVLSLGMPWPGALLFGAANVFEAGAASYALDRIGVDGHSFYDPRDFSVYTLLCSCAAALGSLLAVWALHHIGDVEVGAGLAWTTRTLAHSAAMLIVSPAILCWWHHPRLTGAWKQAVEGAALSAYTMLATVLLFAGNTRVSVEHLPLTFLLILAAVWAAARFGVRETATVLLVLAAGAGWGTLRGYGPFAGVPRDLAVGLLQGFLATLAVLSVTLASAIWRAKDERAVARAAREQLALVTDAAPALIAYIDRALRYRFVNGAYLRWYGIAPDRIAGRRVDEILQAEAYALVRPKLKEALAGKLVEFEADLAYGGERRWVSVVFTPDRRPDGSVQGVVGLATDISRLKTAEAALRESERRVNALNRELERRVEKRTARLRQVNEELESFCYAVAHDLRSPLRKMSGFSEAVLQDYGSCLGEGGASQLRRIFDASRRMARLIDDMLTLSNVTRREMADELVDLSGLARQIGGDLQENEPGRRVQLIVAGNLTARGDPGLVETLLRQLLDNAWKFTRKQAQGRIEVSQIPQEPDPIFFVRDNGVGFDEEQRRKLFTSYQRLHSDFEGHGIGLATAQRVVQRHGGRLWAEGEPGRGATFYFTLHAP